MTDPTVAVAPAAPRLLLGPDAGAPAVPRARAGEWLALVALAVGLLLPPLLCSEYRLSAFNRYLALAILALGVDLIWGYTGLLSLGQGVFFGLGAYSVALSLKLQKAAGSSGTLTLPDYMDWNGLTEVPAWIAPLFDVRLALLVAVGLPTLVAALFALVTFRQAVGQARAPVALLGVLGPFLLGFALWRLLGWGLPLATVAGALLAALSVGATSRALARVGLLTGADGPARVRGVYFSLITQAFVLVAFLWVRNQQAYTGGVNGINNLAKLRLAGHTFARPGQLYVLIAAALFLCYLGCAGLVRTKFGKVLTAIRDNENRVLALGYNTAAYKAAAFTLAGALAGLAGALFVPANGSTGPGHMDVVFSINAVVWVAVGGRGTLVGAVLGAVLVGFAETTVSSAAPDYWPIMLGGLFVGVVVFLPEGVVGAVRRLRIADSKTRWGGR